MANQIKYLSLLATLLLVYSGENFAMETNKIVINNESKQHNVAKWENNNLQVQKQNKKDENINNKLYDEKYHSIKKYIMNGYSKIQEHLKTFCNITKKIENSLQDIMKYSDNNNNVKEISDTIQRVYYNFLSFDDNATPDEKKYAKSLYIPDTILSYVMLRNSNNNIDNFNNTISDNNDIVKKVNILLKIIESQDINDIKEFIKEQKEILSVIEYKIEDTSTVIDPYDCERKLDEDEIYEMDTYYNNMSPEDRKQLGSLHMKHANVVSNFIRTCYSYNGGNENDIQNGGSNTNYHESIDYSDDNKIPNLNVGKIDKTYNGTIYYQESKDKRNNYGKKKLEQIIDGIATGYLGYSKGDKLSSRDIMKCLLMIAQDNGEQVYTNILQSVLKITDEDKLSRLQKNFDEELITGLIEKLDNKIVEDSIKRLSDVLITLSGDFYIKQETKTKISNNAKQIIKSYKTLIENGNDFINELDKLKNELESFLQNIKK